MKIIDIDRKMTKTEDGMVERYLELDGIPPPGWADIFENIHRNDMDMQKRRISVSNKWIVVICPLEEIQRQIVALNRLCELADREYIEIHEQRNAAKQAAADQKAKVDKKANDFFDGLKFD